MYYRVKLTNSIIDNSTAEIVPYGGDGGIVIPYVYSDNLKMRQHLEEILTQEAYVLVPSGNDRSVFFDGVYKAIPNTLQFMELLPEILMWHGYDCVFVNETHKSLSMIDLGYFVGKSASDVYHNRKGERIVRRVPKGYLAIHSDGRAVRSGGWINANIDKEDANWTLIENPYEEFTPDKRREEREDMEIYLREYHPGVEEGLYEDRLDEDYYYTEYKPASGKKLSELYSQIERVEEVSPTPPPPPVTLEPGKIVYSPSTGHILLSENWPPNVEGYDRVAWYVFDKLELSDDEKGAYASLVGASPQLVAGLDKQPVLQTDTNLDISAGIRLTIPGRGDVSINLPVGEKIDLVLDVPDLQVVDRLQEVKGYTSVFDPDTGKYTISGALKSLEVPYLHGMYANFAEELHDYQKPAVLVLAEESQYEAFGGPRGWHGQFLNFSYGLGKTAIVTAADAVMRNRGLFKTGIQTTIVTAPNKNVHVWQSEIAKFRQENAVVIDGDRSSRVEQWEALIERANNGTLPSFVVVGASKFRYAAKGVEDEDVLGIDAQYMKLLSLGGSVRDKTVKGGHVSALVIDESGQYVSPGTARHKALSDIIDSVYRGKGVTWTLNGDISGNSASDTISEVSFVNKAVRDNYSAVVNKYTKRDQNAVGPKDSARRVWKDHKHMNHFAAVFRPHIYTLSGRVVAGDDYGLNRTMDMGSELGHTWGKVYNEAERKLVLIANNAGIRRSLGLMSVMIQASLGALHPARILEYDLASRDLIHSVGNLLGPTDFVRFKEEMRSYLNAATEEMFGVGLVPKSIDIHDRNIIYSSIFSETSRLAMERAVRLWDAPIIDSILEGIDHEIKNHPPTVYPKIGVAGFSKTAMRTIYDRLLEKYGDRVVVQIVDGDTTSEEVNERQQRHQQERHKPVVTVVTSAGLYGLSLPSTRSFRLATWNSAKAGQYEGRFHRSPTQENLVTVVVPDGICQYIREVEMRKRQIEVETRRAVLFPGSEFEDDVDETAALSFIGRLSQYRPRIREMEGGQG